MPWLPLSTTSLRWLEIVAACKISKWPNAETPRIDARFRMLQGEGLPFPRASRYLFELDPLDVPTPHYYGWVDVLWVPASNHLFGSSGVGNNGREVTLTITEYDTSVDPIFSKRGILHEWTYQIDGGGVSKFWFMWDIDFFGDFTTPLQIVCLGLTQTTMLEDFEINGPTDWIGPFAQKRFEWKSTNQCYVIEEEVPPPVGLFATFNDVDATYKLDTFNSGSSLRWKFEYDIRALTTTEKVVFGFSGSSLLQQNWSGKFCAWRQYLVDTVDPLPVGTWVHIEFSYEWDALDDTLRCFKDGVPAGITVDANVTATGGDQFGKRGATIKGAFDLRNFVLTHGGSGAPLIEIDCPMLVDACDIGPQDLGGTVVNMPLLPTCPP